MTLDFVSSVLRKAERGEDFPSMCNGRMLWLLEGVLEWTDDTELAHKINTALTVLRPCKVLDISDTSSYAILVEARDVHIT